MTQENVDNKDEMNVTKFQFSCGDTPVLKNGTIVELKLLARHQLEKIPVT